MPWFTGAISPDTRFSFRVVGGDEVAFERQRSAPFGLLENVVELVPADALLPFTEYEIEAEAYDVSGHAYFAFRTGAGPLAGPPPEVPSEVTVAFLDRPLGAGDSCGNGHVCVGAPADQVLDLRFVGEDGASQGRALVGGRPQTAARRTGRCRRRFPARPRRQRRLLQHRRTELRRHVAGALVRGRRRAVPRVDPSATPRSRFTSRSTAENCSGAKGLGSR